MTFVKEIFKRSPILSWLGLANLVLSIVLLILLPFNEIEVLGINSLIKPLKFSLSIWIYAWTMAYIVHYIKNKTIVRRFEIFAAVTMIFEQGVIVIQAFRGTLSHFNISTPVDSMLFSLMGVFIFSLTVYTLYMTIQFRRQDDTLDKVFKEALFLGLLIFVISSFLGGTMASRLSHNVGGEMGGAGLPFVNWSVTIGDLRVAHFIGLHALQIIPLIGVVLMNYIKNSLQGVRLIRTISFVYFSVVALTFIQALLALPFFRMG